MNDAHQHLHKGFHVDDNAVQNVKNLVPGPSTTEHDKWRWDGIDPTDKQKIQCSKPTKLVVQSIRKFVDAIILCVDSI